jgi:hypothetical protein
MTIRRLTPDQARELVVNTEPWLSCDDCFRLMDEYVELLVEDPGSTAMPEMHVHLRACPACAEEAESLLALVREDR